MKNPFEKDNKTILIVAAAFVSVAAGALAFLFLTEKGTDARKDLKKKLKSMAKNGAADAIIKKAKIKKKAIEAVADHDVK
jgi:hypothetical protein